MALNINFAKGKGWNCPVAAPSFTSIGTIGTAGQMAAGHVLTSSSFPSASVGSNLSWWSLSSLADASGNGRTLTSPNSNTYGTDILGNASNCLTLNGSNQHLTSADTLFNPGDNDWSGGAWIKPSSWTGSSNQQIFNNRNSGGVSYWLDITAAGNLRCYATYDSGSNWTTLLYNLTGFSLTWHHVAAKYVASSNTLMMYFDGGLVAQSVMPSGMTASGSPALFNIGSYQNGTGEFFSGSMDEIFFGRYALTDNDIAKIYAAKYSHNQNISPVSQKWIFQAQNDGQTRELIDCVVDMQANDLYYDLSEESPTTQVSFRLANIY